MSRIGSPPAGIYSDDGLLLLGLLHPNGKQFKIDIVRNNYPNLNPARAIIKNWIANQGVNALTQHQQVLESALAPLVLSTAWAKIIELGVFGGANTTGGLVKLKYPWTVGGSYPWTPLSGYSQNLSNSGS